MIKSVKGANVTHTQTKGSHILCLYIAPSLQEQTTDNRQQTTAATSLKGTRVRMDGVWCCELTAAGASISANTNTLSSFFLSSPLLFSSPFCQRLRFERSFTRSLTLKGNILAPVSAIDGGTSLCFAATTSAPTAAAAVVVVVVVAKSCCCCCC